MNFGEKNSYFLEKVLFFLSFFEKNYSIFAWNYSFFQWNYSFVQWNYSFFLWNYSFVRWNYSFFRCKKKNGSLIYSFCKNSSVMKKYKKNSSVRKNIKRTGGIALTPRGSLPLRFIGRKGGSTVGVNSQVGKPSFRGRTYRVNLGRTNWNLRPLRDPRPWYFN